MKRKTIAIDCFYKPVVARAVSVEIENPSPTNVEVADQENLQAEQEVIVTTAFERDPGKRVQISAAMLHCLFDVGDLELVAT
ncbi:hypothetical protein OsI_13129 [Oryza sativa Indica Group]|uniref:Uncharacterized protein n=1 Tax=Oryza sativa subsp. indica TaxID=39946 RepID=B8APZ0_ORYSI|nr:hypothetical protein OsI_13129 [Oryza sativa Indica Group]